MSTQFPKKRSSFTDIERQGLRAHHQKYPATSRPALASWFELQFGRKISISSVHDILSDKYAYLDGAEATGAIRKQRGPQWRDLELALLTWWQEEQPRRITGTELKDKANQLWQLIPACHGAKMPSFSEGWLTNWRTRHGVAQLRPSATACINPSGQVTQGDIDRRRTKRQYTQAENVRIPSNFFLGRETSENTALKLSLEPFSYRNQPSPSSHPQLWKGLAELFSEFSCQTERDVIIPSEKVLGVFKPIFGTAESRIESRYDKVNRNWLCSEVGWTAFSNAVALLESARLFKLPRSVHAEQSMIYEEWFLDFMSPAILRLQSPDLPEFGAPIQDTTGALSSHRNRKLQSRTVASIILGSGARVDIWSKTYVETCTAEQTDAMEHFDTSITITAPPNEFSAPQTVFRLAQQASQFSSTLFTPIISFRRTRPDSHEIFSIAQHGTSEILQKVLSNGTASLNDCDTRGRSLINYALHGLNASTLKYLLTKIDDPNAYEVTYYGHLRPLICMLPEFDYTINPSKRNRKLLCLDLMLDHGADPGIFGSTTPGTSAFDKACLFSCVETVKLMLNKGTCFVSTITRTNCVGQLNPLRVLPCITWSLLMSISNSSEKVFLLLERGADANERGQFGGSSLHKVFSILGYSKYLLFEPWDELKDILMCLVTAGADVDVRDELGRSVSELAFQRSLEGLWMEVLAECGYDVASVIQSLGQYYYQLSTCLGVFAAVQITVRPSKLSFAEYKKQRRQLWPSTNEHEGESRWKVKLKKWEEWEEIRRTYEEESEDEDGGDYGDITDIYSTEHGSEWWQ